MKYCINCGKQLPAEAKFCVFCGAQQHSLEAPLAPSESAASAPGSVMQTNQEPVQSTAQTAQTPPYTNTANQAPIHPSPVSPAQNQELSGPGQIQQPAPTDIAGRVAADNQNKSIGDMVKSQVMVGPLSKDAAIVQHKVELGYPARNDNFVLAGTPIEWKDIFTSLRGFTGMKSKNYIMSFEDGGVLLMGCTGLVSFNGDDILIESSRIGGIELEKYPLADWDHMYMTVDDQQIEFLIASISPISGKMKWILPAPWHVRNAPKLLHYTK